MAGCLLAFQPTSPTSLLQRQPILSISLPPPGPPAPLLHSLASVVSPIHCTHSIRAGKEEQKSTNWKGCRSLQDADSGAQSDGSCSMSVSRNQVCSFQLVCEHHTASPVCQGQDLHGAAAIGSLWAIRATPMELGAPQSPETHRYKHHSPTAVSQVGTEVI